MRVLILGSEGTVGKSISNLFVEKGHDVVRWDIKLGEEYDLRKEGCLDSIIESIDFVIFLAFDVGGAKYDVNSFDYLDDNLLLIHNTFTSLKKYNKPFIHSTSTMSNMNHNSYAVLKRLAELYTLLLDGVNIKLWNVYGNEEIGLKSHVIPDFISQAITSESIHIRSSGLEERMFLHCDDFSNALYTIFENYSIIDRSIVIDVSSDEWISIKSIAYTIQKIMKESYGKDITISSNGNFQDSHNKRNEPDLTIISKFWKQSISIENGIRDMIKKSL